MRPVANLRFKSCSYGLIQCGAEEPRRFRGLPMRFLLRMAFWLTVILALLPSGGSQPAPKVNVSAGEAVSAAQATVSDVGSFCERQPNACSVGSQAAAAIGQRAQAGAQVLYEYFNGQFQRPE